MQHATRHSLVVLDELGRGTSTFDGYSIAHAVLHHVSSSIACRTLFATHYHGLTTDFSRATNVAMGHMSALVGPSGTGKPPVHCQCCPANANAETKAETMQTMLGPLLRVPLAKVHIMCVSAFKPHPQHLAVCMALTGLQAPM